MTEFFTLIFSNFWYWLGFFLILTVPFSALVKIVRLLARKSNIASRGWPPEHLDADGDFERKEEKDE